MYEKIKLWYQQKLWNADMVQNAAKKGVITQEQASGIIENAKTAE